MRSARTLIRFITVFGIMLGGVAWSQELWAQEVCTFTQVTNSDQIKYGPTISADGTRIVFTSQVDHSSIHVFLFDTTTKTLTRLTNPPGSDFHAIINADGTRIAFWSESDLTGQNPDGNWVVFLYDITTNMFTQLVDFPPPYGAESEGYMAINADGTRVVFLSDVDLTGQREEDHWNLFLYDAITTTLTQLADGGGLGLNIGINADGTRIVFSSRADLTGQNPDGGDEIFLFDTTTSSFTQLTDSTTNDNFSPSLNADGARIAFRSNADLGQNEIILLDTTTNTLTQLTASQSNESYNPTISADGTRIAFTSEANLTGQNPDGAREIFLFDTTTKTLTQLADGGGDSHAINADGTRIVFTSNDDLTDQIVDRRGEVFLADCSSTPPQGVLENPQPASFPSGIGAISGWVCSADVVEIVFDDGAPFEAAYGTSRGDTVAVCGDANNGFSLLFNWNLLGDGQHTVRVLADGVEVANVTVTVTTLGLGEFPTGLSGMFTLTDFPAGGEATNIQWQQSQQNFVIVSGSASGGGSSGSGGQVLENPQPGSFQSGIGVISGFVCDATLIEISFNGGPRFEAAYGTSRDDTAGTCGDANNGFSLLFNWNLLGDGVHTMRALADGVEFASVTIAVTTLGLGEFPTGLSGEFTLPDFPQAGTETSVQWQQSQQNFVIVDIFTPQPELLVSVSSLGFGENPVGSSSEHSFDVTNSGEGTLTGTVTTAAPFSILSGAAFSLSAGESQMVTVRFSPTSPGSFNGSASIMSNGGTASISLSGMGLLGGGGDPNCEVVFPGSSFLKVINALGTNTGGLDVEIVFLEALVRPGACELYGLPADSYTVDITRCEFSAADVAIGDFSDCTSVGATRSVSFTLGSADTHTVEVTPSFFAN